MNRQQRRFVEEMGLLAEHAGAPRMAGRIMGWLLICDPPHQSAAQIADALGASAGSVSTMTRLLESVGFLARVAVPGSRRTHFRVRDDAWSEMMRARMRFISAFRELAERGLRVVPKRGEAGRRLRDMRDFYAFMEEEMPAVFRQWDKCSKRGTRRATRPEP